MSSENLTQMFERNLINICKDFDSFMCIIDAFTNFGNTYFTDKELKKDFFLSLKSLSSAIYHQQSEVIRKCFCFSGVGGEEARKYALEKFKSYFNEEEKAVMQFLDNHGQCPEFYRVPANESIERAEK